MSLFSCFALHKPYFYKLLHLLTLFRICMIQGHSFHIPVMGLGFTIDSPVKVAHYGISSVVALANDSLIEQMREFYCRQFSLPYTPIPRKEPDYRSARIREYLNTLDIIVRNKIEEVRNSVHNHGAEFEKYIDLLPEMSEVKKSFNRLVHGKCDVNTIWQWAKEHLVPGNIDVNIMTKLDKENFHKGEKLPQEYNDAHAALRGFATSNLRSSIVLSAGLNPYLYSYMEQFPDFYPDSEGVLRKKIILKVSDYRSALIQGKMLAKKGLWVTEYRVESGLNCGGHAFATDGYLMGPVLEEFRVNRQTLSATLHDIYVKGLTDKGISLPEHPFPLLVTAQGGVGTAEEHQLLLEHFEVDSVGWGTPFLLVPEATSVDEDTLRLLADAREEDLYLSNVSPIGVPFNNVRNNTKDLEKEARILAGNPGSPCTLQHLKLFRDDAGNPICTASREYQQQKLAEADAALTDQDQLAKTRQNILDKVCLCVGLATSTKMAHGIDTKAEGTAVAVCPGPNLAWFDRVVSLSEMTNHIYGKGNIISRTDRPHMFINELRMYVDYLKHKMAEEPLNARAANQIRTFRDNLLKGIDYYHVLFDQVKERFNTGTQQIKSQLSGIQREVSGWEI
jgi:hypothetical protein